VSPWHPTDRSAAMPIPQPRYVLIIDRLLECLKSRGKSL
jgi:hypothetical protein